ncbi:MAG TPA: 30S ribosomal protein S9 [Verrucomicrobiae bacterium]|jgi:small subunit ribosomal protein S9|nr:30S ribosomal protein S9 [Verrucomicrobiae bacterium]
MAANSFYGTGRRKSAIARVWLFPGQKGFKVNGRDCDEYLRRKSIQALAEKPLRAANLFDRFRVRAQVVGGGIAGQADAISLGIARALLDYDVKLRSMMRQGGFLTRDPREKERKKPGRKGARRRFQFTKR